MPLPAPQQSEEREEFIQRCMSDENVIEEFADNNQRHGVCSSLYEGTGNDNFSGKEMSQNLDYQGLKEGEYVQLKIGMAVTTGYLEEIIDNSTVIDPSTNSNLSPKDDDPIGLIRLVDVGESEADNYKLTNKIVARYLSEIRRLGMEREESENSKSKDQNKEVKHFKFEVTETKAERDIGIVKGYASTFGNIDRGGDLISQGAFSKSLARYKKQGRPIKMFYQHDNMEIIGGFPIDKVEETEFGLKVEGQINLNVQRGKEAYHLARQGVLTDFSIGYTVEDFEMRENYRELKELELWEVSLVGEPMNEMAVVTSVKSVPSVTDMKMASKEVPFREGEALARVKEFCGVKEKANRQYRRAFMYYDEKQADNPDSYKMLVTDIVDNEMKIIPKAVRKVSRNLEDYAEDLDLSENEYKKIKNNLIKLYEKMGKSYPYKELDKLFHIKDVWQIKDKKEFEALLRESGAFSRKAAVYLASQFNPGQSDSVEQKKNATDNDISELKQLIQQYKGIV
jgi:HK97 family phage prohead protease